MYIQGYFYMNQCMNQCTGFATSKQLYREDQQPTRPNIQNKHTNKTDYKENISAPHSNVSEDAPHHQD